MKRVLTLVLTLACIGSLFLGLPIQVFSLLSPDQSTAPSVPINQSNDGQKDIIRDKAKLISVRVLSVNSEGWKNSLIDTLEVSGSGILVQRQEAKPDKKLPYLYLVLTNNHIISKSSNNPSKESYIQTPDGLIHKGFPHPDVKFVKDKIDLGLLRFYSPYRYETAVKGKSKDLSHREKIYVAGFPCELTSREMSCPAEFTLTEGEALRIDKPLQDGYQIAYTNDTKEGTSGGAILNSKGELVGINGRGKDSLSSPQYQYADSSGSPPETQNEPLALGIPIETYISKAPKNPFDKVPAPPKEVGYVSYGHTKSTYEPRVNQTQTTPRDNPEKQDNNNTTDILFGGLNIFFILSFIVAAIIVVLLILLVVSKLRHFRGTNLRGNRRQSNNSDREETQHSPTFKQEKQPELIATITINQNDKKAYVSFGENETKKENLSLGAGSVEYFNFGTKKYIAIDTNIIITEDNEWHKSKVKPCIKIGVNSYQIEPDNDNNNVYFVKRKNKTCDGFLVKFYVDHASRIK